MAATHGLDSIRSARPVLYLAFELSSSQWKVTSTTARGQSLVLSRCRLAIGTKFSGRSLEQRNGSISPGTQQ